jgi:Uma2 family endonuclease
MLMMAREPDAQTTRVLLEYFLSLDTPEGYRAQLIDGEIVVTPPPAGNHERAISRIAAQVARNSLVPMDASGGKGLIVPSHGIAAAGRVIPDLTFAPEGLDLFHHADPWMPAAGVAMVLEVTSSDPYRDRDAKRHAYAGAAIPLYLLVDRQFDRVTLFGDPAHDDYKRTLSVPFGDALELPKPFGFTLDTASFTD